jgi:predicted nucleotidyltransferase
MSTERESAQSGSDDRSGTTAAVVEFLEGRGVTTYAVKRTPSSIVLSLPNEPESAVQRHLEGLKGRLKQSGGNDRADTAEDFVVRDPRDHHGIVIEIIGRHDTQDVRDTIVEKLKSEEAELRRRGIDALLLFGSATASPGYPNDVDLLARFRPGLRLSAFDIAEIQGYLEDVLGRRVDLSNEKTFPSAFRVVAERDGIRIFQT